MMNETTKRTPAVSAEIDENLGGLTLTFAGGETLRLEVGMLTPRIGAYALMHGLKQKLIDAAAISRNPDTGRSATPTDKYNAVKAVYDRLLAGQWSAARGEGGTGSGGLLFRALCRMYPAKTPEALREYLAGKSAAEQAALRKNAKISAVIEEIKAESAGDDASADSDAMLAELED